MRANIKYVLNFYEYFFFDQILTMISDHYAEPLKTSCSRLRELALKSVMDVLASLRCVCVAVFVHFFPRRPVLPSIGTALQRESSPTSTVAPDSRFETREGALGAALTQTHTLKTPAAWPA